VPERFCLTLQGRRARSASLLVGGMVGSVRNLYRSPVPRCLAILLRNVLAVRTVEESAWLLKAVKHSASSCLVSPTGTAGSVPLFFSWINFENKRCNCSN